MLGCDYTESTVYNFHNKCCTNSEKINVLGEYPSDYIENVLTSSSDNKWTEFFLPEVVDIPKLKPNMEGIIEVLSGIEIISQRVVKTPVVKTTVEGAITGATIPNSENTRLTGRKLVVEGLLKQKVIYTAAVEEQSVHTADFEMPFSAFIIIDGNTPLSQKFSITPYIEDIFVCRLSERSIFKNTTIFIKASKIC